jgi:RNA-directed DNA polymerase
MHHIHTDNLRKAFRELDGSKACGVDGITKQQYELELESNLRALHDTIRRGGWRPKPSREVLIPKPQGGTRPLAVGCLEDKIVQRLTARILEAVYEPLFHRHSYGFRGGKSPHQAIGRLYSVMNARRAKCVVVEMDIEKFFNSVSHEWLLQKLKTKIDDAHFLRHIERLLRASILHENGQLSETEIGTPQGSPVSPVLANICLHYLLDEWFDAEFSSHGEFVRYADDAVFVFTDEAVARNFQTALQRRLEEAGLSLNVSKSAVIPFQIEAPKGVVTFLGFDFYWGRNLKREKMLKVKTSAKRLHRSMQNFTQWVKEIRNQKPLKVIWGDAAARLRGHFNYFGVVFNETKLSYFHFVCTGALFKWLNRRSQKRSFDWEKFLRKLEFNPLPSPPRGEALVDVTSEFYSVVKHQPKSRMRVTCTSGSDRSPNRSRRLRFT